MRKIQIIKNNVKNLFFLLFFLSFFSSSVFGFCVPGFPLGYDHHPINVGTWTGKLFVDLTRYQVTLRQINNTIIGTYNIDINSIQNQCGEGTQAILYFRVPTLYSWFSLWKYRLPNNRRITKNYVLFNGIYYLWTNE